VHNAGLNASSLTIFQDALCETSYQAEVAALTCEVSPEGAAGLSLRLDGFSHRLPDLAGVVFRTLATLKVRCGSLAGHVSAHFGKVAAYGGARPLSSFCEPCCCLLAQKQQPPPPAECWTL